MRDYRSARRHFEEALVDLRDVGSLGEQAQAYNNLAAAYEREEEWGRALEYYEASLQLKEQAGDRIGAARTKANIGSVHHARIRDIDDPPRAERMADSARKLYAESLETFEAYGARSEAAKVRYKQALLYYQNGEVDQARGLLPEVLREYRALRIPGVEVVENLAGRMGVG
jgi:tetratricopeptide (TPR) repeat protein